MRDWSGVGRCTVLGCWVEVVVAVAVAVGRAWRTIEILMWLRTEVC
jgi:hypothetical protein